MVLIDRFLADYAHAELHQLPIPAPPSFTYQALLDCDLGRSRLVKLLLRLRGLPTDRLTLRDLSHLGFAELGAAAPDELVLGLIARPWTAAGGLRATNPDDFVAFAEPGFARIVWGFRVEPHGDGSLLVTETRIQCTDPRSAKRFRRYWAFVRPFSGLLRILMLREIRSHVLRGQKASKA